MKKIKFKKIKWKNLLLSVLGIAIILGSVAGVVALVRRDTKTISPTVFERGALDDNGVYVASNQSVYTKDAFECRGLKITPDFEYDGTYDVYYYSESGSLLQVRKGLTGIYDEDYPLATHARVVINPTPVVKEGEKVSDFKIKFWEVVKYANMLDIKVSRDQEGKYETLNLYVDANSQKNKSFDIDGWKSPISIVDDENMKVSEAIFVEYDCYDIYVRCTASLKSSTNVVIVDSDTLDVHARSYISAEDTCSGEWKMMTITVPEDAEGDLSLYLRMPTDTECYIFGYNK